MATRPARHLPGLILRTGLLGLALAVVVTAPLEASTDGSGVHLIASRTADSRPAGGSAKAIRAADNEAALAYWTKERMERATPADVHVKAGGTGEKGLAADRGAKLEVKGSSPTPGAKNGSPGGKAVADGATSAPTAGSTATAAAASGGMTEGYWQASNTATPNLQIGKLFYQQWDTVSGTWKDYNCSGTVVASEGGSVVWTAGHCVYNTYANTWNRGYKFCPGYRAGVCAKGEWTPSNHNTTTAWMSAACSLRPTDQQIVCTEAEFLQDFGVLKMNKINGWTIQQWVGSQGIAFSGATVQSRYLFGYPLNKSNGEYLYYCAGTNSLVNAGGTAVNLLMSPCGAGGGASGGPWLSSINSSWFGTVLSVNSHGGTGSMAGPYQGSVANGLYNTVRY